VAAKRERALVGGKRPHKRNCRANGWTKAKAGAFLNILVETCNVTLACRESGVAMTTAYNRRKSDAAFRAQWLEAIGIAYQRLELELLDRAFNGLDKLVTKRDGSSERIREYSNQLGLQLLKMHRDEAVAASAELPPGEIAEIRAKLVQKLKRLSQRRTAKASGE